MKRLMIVTIAALLALAAGTQAFAKSEQMGNAEVDASLVVASAPTSEFDNTLGLAIGGGVMVDNNIQARVDLTFLSFDGSFFGTDLTYSRIPVTVSGRYYIPTDSVKAFVQGGLELSFDKIDVGTFIPGFKLTSSETNLGATAGAGLDVPITSQLSFVADVRLHLISNDYVTLQGGVAMHF
jgi:opacity protein-like surface antigen